MDDQQTGHVPPPRSIARPRRSVRCSTVITPDRIGAGPCPCGSGTGYARCCGPIHADAKPPTAERAMRARYSAYAVGDTVHLLRSWHPDTRPSVLDLDPTQEWIG